MKIDVTKVVLDSDFKPILEGQPPVPSRPGEPERPDTRHPTTLRDIIRRALTGQHPEEKKLSEDEKFKRFMLAMRVHEALILVDLTPAESKEILKVANLFYGPLLYGQIAYAFDNPAKSEDQSTSTDAPAEAAPTLQ